MSENRERIHVEDGPKRVRTYLGGELIADTKRLKLVWEVPYYPAYYFPQEDVHMDLLTPNDAYSTGRAGACKQELQLSVTPPVALGLRTA